MSELNDAKLKRLVGKAHNEANARADELEALGAPDEVVRLVRPRSAAEPQYQQTHIQAYEIRLADKIELGGHLCEIVGVGEEGLHSIIIHAIDPAHRVYELKTSASQPLTIQRKK